MCNLSITPPYYTTQLTLPLEGTVENIVSKRQCAPTFKSYNNRQVQVIFDIEELIPVHHVARVVDEMVEAIPDDKLFSHYPGGGRPSFHPKMMLKVILFGYSQKVYSCRGIEQLTRENIPTMWLAAMQQPDYRTINEFRGRRMKSMMNELYETMILKLIEANYITMENYFLDGTKIEANANKYSFVWKKSTIRFEEKLKEKIRETLRLIEETAKEEELEILADNLMDTVEDPSKLEEIAVGLETHIAVLSDEMENETNTEVRKEKRKRQSTWKKSLKLIRKDFLPRLAKYKAQNETFGDRNSYSKTDSDATFMRMKEDHMKNGQLKPGYNVQMATENQFILFYTIHQRPTDTRCFIPHLEKLASSWLPMPKNVIADAGYGSEENYLYAVGEEKEPRFDFLIPYGTYLKEKTRKAKRDIKSVINWVYVEKDDCFICPNGMKVTFKKYQNKKNASGHEQSYKIYECEDCSGCPFKSQCTKGKGNRQVHWNTIFEEMKAKAKAALECEDKAAIYARRKVEVESVFGHIKGNRSFRRFSLRGLDKVHVEFGIVALAHNLLKVAGIRLATFLKPIRAKKEAGGKTKRFSPSFFTF
ncbi:IS1182 family transposase [Brevibacillus ruminantium]|uniref:IS1182 family transposase n=1 Tax=Brevibacillus ruminantium TaxID=2950604 RepID=A0ABY4WAM4_9BACL|nr:IS1182 family transposase [Brevibacillus ruminantium]USG63901.1 IS1182 family transposase [Brevibacillus ruminantium]USG65906.1 IS1182 family transposase [Brevibacillus ruminantium]USG66092.1 IS1182 family transposase [Brevibacillus ruminantium]USG66555.1 IS1182 family transposase [Brevibacillus ruminantium]